MTHRQRFVCALEMGTPDYVPTFELEFQLEEELCGKRFLRQKDLEGKTKKETEKLINDNVDYILQVYEKLDHDAICLHYLNEENLKATARRIRELTGDEYMLCTHGDGTFAIPDGNQMLEFVYRIADDPDSVYAEAEALCTSSMQRNARMREAGFDGFILCSDYCFNKGPFLSPEMMDKFVFPYLSRVIYDIRNNLGGYAIKHTDGDIMPIIGRLVDANPHALHSLDPMAGVDIAEVKRLYGHRVALAGNVHCAAMQTGTEAEVIASAEYCLTHAKPGGGYIYATSNIPFKGLPLERYMLVLDVWKKMRDY